MKRFIYLAACASLTLAGCVNDENLGIDEVQDVAKKITFSAPVVGANSRVIYGEMESPYNTEETFNVFAVKHAGNYTTWESGEQFMDDVMVASAEIDGKTTWVPEDDYFWPLNHTLTFGAYSPTQVGKEVGEGMITYSSAGLKIKDFTVPEIGKQYDLMYSDLARSKTSASGSSSSYYTGVDINFRHALSSIKFKAKKAGNFDAWIKKITIVGVYNKGTFEQAIDPSSSQTEAHTKGSPHWNRDTEQTVDYVVYEAATGEDGLKLTDEPVSIGHNLLLLPQIFSGTLANANAKIRVDYKVGHNTANFVEPLISTLSEDWVMGRRYTYTIILGGSGEIQRITFAPSVENWTDAGGNLNI